jgi:hypothetical protein
MRLLDIPLTYAFLKLGLDDVCAKNFLEIRYDYMTEISSRSTGQGDFAMFELCCEVDKSGEFVKI